MGLLLHEPKLIECVSRSSVSGEIRCYCDAPHCVATGYMCKSELNACFTKVLDPLNTNSPLTHGCLDPVANAADVCSSGGPSKSSDIFAPLSATLECCHDDMCNYRGLHDVAHTRESTGRIIPRTSAAPRFLLNTDMSLAGPQMVRNVTLVADVFILR